MVGIVIQVKKKVVDVDYDRCRLGVLGPQVRHMSKEGRLSLPVQESIH